LCLRPRPIYQKTCSTPSSPGGSTARPLCGGGTAQTVNRIFIILQRWHFPVIFSFYDHFSSLALIRRLYYAVYSIYNTIALLCRKKPTPLSFSSLSPYAGTHIYINIQKPLGFIFNLQNDVEIESAATGSSAQWLLSAYTKYSFFLSSLLCISDVWPYSRPVPVSFLFISFGIHRSTLSIYTHYIYLCPI